MGVLNEKRCKSADESYIFEGHTIVFCSDKILHIENNASNDIKIEDIDGTTVFTNHGVITNEGYVNGIKGLSSFLRRKIVETELANNKPKTIDELVNLMNRNYTNVDPRFHPYRDKRLSAKMVNGLEKKPTICTTSQIVLNMTDKELIYYKDLPNSQNVCYVNNLPKDYIPKLKITLKETQKDLKPRKIFTQKYLKELSDCFLVNTNETANTKTKRMLSKNRSKTCKRIKVEN